MAGACDVYGRTWWWWQGGLGQQRQRPAKAGCVGGWEEGEWVRCVCACVVWCGVCGNKARKQKPPPVHDWGVSPPPALTGGTHNNNCKKPRLFPTPHDRRTHPCGGAAARETPHVQARRRGADGVEFPERDRHSCVACARRGGDTPPAARSLAAAAAVLEDGRRAVLVRRSAGGDRRAGPV